MAELLNICHVEVVEKHVILLSDKIVVLYQAGSSTGIESWHIKFTLSAGPCSIDDLKIYGKSFIMKTRLASVSN